ncbi:MAG: hypothetical protein NTY12_04575 [Candidatus Falkowbacteria bacterium]|nr:hypothetical protein [Candidatus Falkowbacteria bacterium]
MKKNLALIIAIITISSLAGFGVVQAKGQDNDNFKGKAHSQKINIETPKDFNENFPMASREDETALKNESNLKTVITKGSNMIDMRLNALNRAKTSINKSKLSANQKTSLIAMIDENINGLTNLKTKLVAETDLALAKADLSSMFTDYRIYGVFMPKLNALRIIDMNSNNLDKIQTTTFTNYQTKIDALKASNGDAALIAKMEAGLAKAKTDASKTSSLISSTMIKAQNLKPADYPTQSKTILKDIKNNLKTIHNDFKLIRTDLGIKGRVNVMTK